MQARLLMLIILCTLTGCVGAQTAGSTSPLVDKARNQIGVTLHYDPAYVKLQYPGGDVPADRGVCTDVIIRAFRQAHGLDLQQKVHEDMRSNFSLYPRRWGLKKPDRNIDHRRVPNLQVWFTRHALHFTPGNDPQNYQPGDVVTCTLPGNLPHIMLVSDQKSQTGIPLVIHNIGAGAREEDILFAFPLTGHYRFKPAAKKSP